MNHTTTPPHDPHGAIVLAMASSLLQAANERDQRHDGPPYIAPVQPDLPKLLRDHATSQPQFPRNAA
jgi:hypothetical protein